MATEIRRKRLGVRATATRALATWSLRAFAALLLMLVLPALGARSAAADDLEEPVVVASSTAEMGSLPGAIVIRWVHTGQGVHDFLVVREPDVRVGENLDAGQRSHTDLNLQPSTMHRYKVCAYFDTEDEEPACSDWVEGRTTPPFTQPQSERPTPPRIVAHYASETSIRIRWEAYDYDSYFINITGPFGTPKGPRELRTIKYDQDGTTGDYTLGGLLPGRDYTIGVQGCTETFFGIGDDHCWDWSAWLPARTLPMALHYGPDTCAPPFVWREAFAGDHVCVEVGRRAQVAKDNALAQSRRAFLCTPPNCTFTAPDTCKVPFVWREARPSDHVCVEVKERTQVAAENGLANQRRAAP